MTIQITMEDTFRIGKQLARIFSIMSAGERYEFMEDFIGEHLAVRLRVLETGVNLAGEFLQVMEKKDSTLYPKLLEYMRDYKSPHHKEEHIARVRALYESIMEGRTQ